MENSKLQFVLASASPRRKELIGHLKIPFEIIALSTPEESQKTDPVSYADEIANLKIEAVQRKLMIERSAENFYLVSADTIVSLDGKIFGKPTDRDEARLFLNELSGKTHSVFTAVALRVLRDGKFYKKSFIEESKVTFNPISHLLMERYLDTGDSLDKAGAYGIQGPSLTFVSKVNGDYANVVGFPLSRFVSESDLFFKSIFSHEGLWQDFF
jgi:septum formation protein